MGCCDEEALAKRRDQRRVLLVVLVVNATLFGVEMVAGILAGSTALLADSLDMLGDALVYAVTLYVLAGSMRVRAQAAALKGLVMVAFGGFVFVEAAVKIIQGSVPEAQTMGIIGTLALAGNAVCFALLYRHRGNDLNMRSTWLCSRNDLIANVSVLAAAALVAGTGSLWPDVVVGVAIAALFFQTALSVLKDAVVSLRQTAAVANRGGVVQS